MRHSAVARLARGLLVAASMIATAPGALAQTASAVPIDDASISGVVRGAGGPEAGVWVIAETRDLPVRFIRIVVTDDEGRYLLPDLPKAAYDVWVRGYGLIDSARQRATPGTRLDHVASPAPDASTAAKVYPAIHWYSMLRIPAADQFGGKSDIPAGISRERWLHQMKSAGCVGCHQLGQLSTRTIPPAFAEGSHADAWMRRVQSGQAGEQMVNQLAGLLGGAPFAYFGEWTERVAKGETPSTAPRRPEGVERNVVVTLRDWMNEKQYLHDLIASDRRHPTVNAYGPLYGSPEYSSDDIPILDPVRNVATTFRLPVSPDTPEALGPGHAAAAEPLQPSAYWGEEKLWNSRANNHNSMFDRLGRVWMAATGHRQENPDFCRKGSDHPSAKHFPLERTNRRVTMLDPKTGRYTAFQTCFQTHHLQFGYDANDTLWTSGGGAVVGWINTRLLDETGDIAKAQGWTAMVLDTNGNGRRDDYVEPNQPLDPTKDKRIQAGFYAVMPSPADGSIWGTNFSFPGAVVRIAPGSNPPETALAEIYNVPLPGFGPRGGDIDKQGVVWVSLSSGHLGSFDRRKCRGPLNGPRATGDHCPEGWSFHQYPGPGFQGIGENSAESSYYTWVDQHNTFGLGEDVPMSTGNLNDGLIAFKDGRMVVLRVPYPLGFYAKGFDGRIDDPNAGWKGRGLWTTNGDRTPWLIEGGKGTRPLTAHFQLRPDPLAR
ncbi:MAG: carboxypeptidase regulatory-like domain-containing protein [Alphaproteobacteria bacterium]|nr:carboxypeptidase regulatory-like domain-containing protein [Alphaproteobacteria bacterium]